MNKRVIVTDSTRRINLATYESRLIKMRMVMAMMLGQLDEALEILEQQKKAEIRLIDQLVKDA